MRCCNALVTWLSVAGRSLKEGPETGASRVSGVDREPGWYPHPRYPDDERYWDGQLWGASRPGGEEIRKPPTPDRVRSLKVVVGFLVLMVAAYFGIWWLAAHTGDPTPPPAAPGVSSSP